MEKYVGIFFVSMILIIMLLSGVEYCSIKCSIKPSEENKEIVHTYGASLLIFSAIAVYVLMSFVFVFSEIESDKILIKSGLLFAIISVSLGAFIQIVYYILVKISEAIAKTTVLYKLNADEVKWTYILICVGLMWLCYRLHMKACAYTYIVLIIGKLLWLDVSIQNLKKELVSMKNLTRSFWYVVVFVIVCIFCATRYENSCEIIISLIGIIIGILVGIYCIYFIDKNFENQKS